MAADSEMAAGSEVTWLFDGQGHRGEGQGAGQQELSQQGSYWTGSMSDVSAAAKKKMKKKERSLKIVGGKARRRSRSCDLRPHMEHVCSRQVPTQGLHL